MIGAQLPNFVPGVDLLLDDDDPDNGKLHPRAQYALYKFLWAAGHRGYALEKMVEFSRLLSAGAGEGGGGGGMGEGVGCSISTSTSTAVMDLGRTMSSTSLGSALGGSGVAWEAAGFDTGRELLSKVFVLIGEWQLAVNEDDLERSMMEEVLKYLQVQ